MAVAIMTTRERGFRMDNGSRTAFDHLTQLSVKVSSYFPVYDLIIGKYCDKPGVTFAEIGVAEGGSLLMWREFLGPDARIIGIDFDPASARMREKGFEIFIGDQASPEFWRDFFSKVGDIDILLDDGGHTNKHQISTVEYCLDHIKDGGVILTEDVGTSYLPDYGNPSKFSFMNYAKSVVERIQLRSPFEGRPKPGRFTDAVFSVTFFESMVCFHVDRQLCHRATIVKAGTNLIGATNQWNVDKRLVGFDAGRRGREMLRSFPPVIEKMIISCYAWINALLARRKFKVENRGLRRFFP
jgi:hypothetical protein